MSDEDALERKYPSNSKSKSEEPDEETEERPKVEPVVTGRVLQRKKSMIKRIVETFAGEPVEDTKQFIVTDVIVPAIKNLISDIATQGIERMLFGEVSRRSSTARGSGRYTSYGSYSSSNNQPARREMSHRARATHDFRDIILETRAEAEDVLNEMFGYIKEYGVATVADLYSLTNITGTFTDNKWGWDNLDNATVRRVREGYMLILPRTMQID